MPTSTMYTPIVIGLETRIEGSPSETASARRSSVSASGPRITPIMSGASGMPKRRMRKPSTPSPTSR